MKQEVIAGVILCAMGLAMLLISPNAWWKAAEKWKTRDGSGPAKSYTVLLRVVGAVFFAASLWSGSWISARTFRTFF